jgi:hypothetical protein
MNKNSGKSVDERLNEYLAPEQPKVEEQPEAMPASDQTAEEPKQEVVSQPVPEGNDVQDEEGEALANSKNPERTKAYIEKLKAERDELKKLKETKQTPVDYGNSVLDSIHPGVGEAPKQVEPLQLPQIPTPYLNPLQKENIIGEFIDADGNVDIPGLNRALLEANRQSYEATQRVQSVEEKLSRIEETAQVREAHAQFPEMDPMRKDVFNPQLFEAVRDRLVRNLWEGKKGEPLAETVKQVKESYFKESPVDTKKVVEQYKQTQQARQQGPLGEGRPRDAESNIDDLRAQTRLGGQRGDAALEKRLKALGIV